MDYKRQVYIIITATEICFALFGIFGPGTKSAWGVFIESVSSFPFFLWLMLLLSAISFVICVGGRFRHVNVFVSTFLLSQWAVLCLTPLLTGFITITYPLFVMIFALRLITTIGIESEVRANGV